MVSMDLGSTGRSLAKFSCILLTVFALDCFYYPGGTNYGIYGLIVGPIVTIWTWPTYQLKQMLVFTQYYGFMALLMACLCVYPLFIL